MKTLLATLLLTTLGALSLSAQNLIDNGDFENGTRGWVPFIPKDAQGSECKFTEVSDGAHAGQSVQLTWDGSTRWGIVNWIKKGNTPTPGERLRISAWVKAGPDFQAAANTPGFNIRVTMFAQQPGPDGGLASAQDGLFYIGMDGRAVRGPDTSSMNNQLPPTEWTKVEGVFEAPPDLGSMNVSVIVIGSGSFLVDDVVLEAVNDSVPLSDVNH